MTCAVFPPAAQLQAAGAERAPLRVGGGADAAAAAGGARELPSGPAPVQLAAPVGATPRAPSLSLGRASFPMHRLFHLRGTALKWREPWLTWPALRLAGGPGRKVFQEMPASPADSSLPGGEGTCSPQRRGLGVRPGIRVCSASSRGAGDRFLG